MWPLLLGIAAYQPGGGAPAWARRAKTIQNRAFVAFRLQAFPRTLQKLLFCIISEGENETWPDRQPRHSPLPPSSSASHPGAASAAQGTHPPAQGGGESTPPAPVHGGARKGKKGLTSSPPRGNIKERKGRCPGSRTTPVFLFPGAAGFFFFLDFTMGAPPCQDVGHGIKQRYSFVLVIQEPLHVSASLFGLHSPNFSRAVW